MSKRFQRQGGLRVGPFGARRMNRTLMGTTIEGSQDPTAKTAVPGCPLVCPPCAKLRVLTPRGLDLAMDRKEDPGNCRFRRLGQHRAAKRKGCVRDWHSLRSRLSVLAGSLVCRTFYGITGHIHSHCSTGTRRRGTSFQWCARYLGATNGVNCRRHHLRSP